MLYESIVRIFRAATYLLIAYVSYVFLRSVGITPYMLIDQVHDLAYNVFAFAGF